MSHGLLTTILLLAFSIPASAENVIDYDSIAKFAADSTVTVKFVMKIKGAQGEAENESEAPGVMIAEDGLVLCANSQMGGGPMVRPGVSTTPSELKILIGDDTQGLDARLMARDSELDLCWLRIKDAGARKFKAVDLSKPGQKLVGKPICSLVRLGKYFDRAIVVREARIGGTVSKPRALLAPSPTLGEAGLPVYDADRLFVGMTVVQLPDADELQAATSMVAFNGFRGLILPAAEIEKATKRAREADEKGDATPAAESQPSTGEKKAE